MKTQLKNLMYSAIMALPVGAFAQSFTEDMGSAPSTQAIAAHDVLTAGGFQNSAAFAFTGTGDVRNSTASTGYTQVGGGAASGLGNIFLTNTAGKTFIISGINTTGLTAPALSFGIYKSTNANDGSEIAVEVSDNGAPFTALTMPVIPSGASGFAKWYYVTCTGSIPSSTNLTIRITNLHTFTAQPATQWRIDDMTLTGGTPTPTCSASVSVIGGLSCGSGSATLTAVSSSTDAGTTYLWAPGGATTSTIAANTAGVYNVTVTLANGCASTAQTALASTPAATVVASATSLSVCAGSTVGLTARTLASDLIISEYTEGSVGNNKYIEIYNGTGAAVTLTNYVYRAFQNGASVPSSIVNLGTFQTSLADGAVLILQNPGATSALGYTTGVVQFNGNDAIGIFNLVSNSYADIFGAIGSDPGAAGWNAAGSRSSVDKTLRRKSTVYSGVTTSPVSGFPTLLTEWDPFFDTDLTGYGSHSINGTYNWSPATSPAAGSPVAGGPISGPTVFTVNASGYVSGCPTSATVLVNTLPSPNVTIDNEVPTIYLCFGDQAANLTAFVSGGTPAYSYNWNTGAITSGINVMPTVTTSYTVVVTDANGCSTTTVSTVEVIDACCEGGTKVLICHNSETECVTPEVADDLVNNQQVATAGPCNVGGRVAAPQAVAKSISRNNISVSSVFPNPFVDAATVEVKVTETSVVKVEIMDYTGKKVAELNNASLAAGSYQFNWNGNNAAGNTVASGLYLCKITSGNTVKTVKLQKSSK